MSASVTTLLASGKDFVLPRGQQRVIRLELLREWLANVETPTPTTYTLTLDNIDDTVGATRGATSKDIWLQYPGAELVLINEVGSFGDEHNWGFNWTTGEALPGGVTTFNYQNHYFYSAYAYGLGWDAFTADNIAIGPPAGLTPGQYITADPYPGAVIGVFTENFVCAARVTIKTGLIEITAQTGHIVYIEDKRYQVVSSQEE